MRALLLALLVVCIVPVAAGGPLPEGGSCVEPEGWRAACAAYGDEQGAEPDAAACAYDGVFEAFGAPWETEAVMCWHTTEGEGFVPAPGLCQQSPRMSGPIACVNGRDACTLWVLSVEIVCWA